MAKVHMEENDEDYRPRKGDIVVGSGGERGIIIECGLGLIVGYFSGAWGPANDVRLRRVPSGSKVTIVQE